MTFDPLGAGLATLAAALVGTALLFTWRYFDTKGPTFTALMLVFLGGLAGFALTGDMFNLFVFFEVMSVSAYALTAYRIERRGPLQGALNFAVTNSRRGDDDPVRDRAALRADGGAEHGPGRRGARTDIPPTAS